MLELLKLSLEYQLILFWGYIACRINAIGSYEHYKPTDVIFHTIVFGILGFVSRVMFDPLILCLPEVLKTPVSFLAVGCVSMAAAVVWRLWGRNCVSGCLRKLNITYDNMHPTTLHHILNCKEVRYWDYLSIICKDGYVLDSDLNKVPKDLALYPCDIDTKGNIAIYVTKFYRPDNTDIDLEGAHFKNERELPQLTFIPASEISRFDLSFSQK